MPAYLETEVAGSVGFYERVGFEVLRELGVLGVRVWGMGRPAR